VHDGGVDGRAEPLAARDAKIVFMPSGRRGVFSHGTALLDAARSIGVDVDSVCGGRGLCGRCRVVAIHSRAEHLSPVGEAEKRFSERRRVLEANHRLSCQALIQGDLVIDVPAESQMHRQVVRRSTPACACTMSRCSEPTCVRPPATCSGSAMRSTGSGS
jgi:uncharacterized 2Fe-2S/4Fe-4S cluster protein (DUF4445 family)